MYTSELKPLYTAFLHSINLSGYRMRTKLKKDPLAVEQKNYSTKDANAYIVYDLDAWPKISPGNFTIKNILFCATAVVKNSDKEKWMCRGYEIAFDEKVEWSFGEDYARNVVIFNIDTSSSSYIDNCKHALLILGERDNFCINGSFGSSE